MLACRREIVDERLRIEAHALVLELHQGHPAAALLRRRRRDTLDERMLPQERGEAAAQLAGAVTVNQPERPMVAEQRIVEEPLGAGNRLVARCSQ